tara:strand:+ start:209 stop:376 length:168 start_codon:yes stop_codon:yes gene_type:complete
MTSLCIPACFAKLIFLFPFKSLDALGEQQTGVDKEWQYIFPIDANTSYYIIIHVV